MKVKHVFTPTIHKLIISVVPTLATPAKTALNSSTFILLPFGHVLRIVQALYEMINSGYTYSHAIPMINSIIVLTVVLIVSYLATCGLFHAFRVKED